MSRELVMDTDVANAFERIYDKIDNLPCGSRGEALARIEQKFENGEKFEATRHSKKIEGLTLWRVLIALGVAVITVMTFINRYM